MSCVRIATRKSDLALAQTRWVAAQIHDKLDLETELIPLVTTGDQIVNRPLHEIGGKGLFIKELEQALLEDRADIAVHSAKDLPALLPSGLDLVAFPRRADPRDALVANDTSWTVETIPEAGRIGTGSIRRTTQLRSLRPDLEIVPLRGNVNTRLAKLGEEDLDGILLASAGLDRLNLSDRITERIDPTHILPAIAQGTLALEMREDAPLRGQIEKLSDLETARITLAERSFLKALQGDCTFPIAALAERTTDEHLRLQALLADPAGSAIARADCEGSLDDPVRLGKDAADSLLRDGGAAILESLERLVHS